MTQETPNPDSTEVIPEAESVPVQEAAAATEQPAPEKPEDKRMFTDEDILEHACNILNNALNMSRENKFQAVGFQFSELELIQRVAAVALDRTRRINSLASNLSNRDKALATSLTSLSASLSKTFEDLSQIAGGVENAKSMAQFFLPEDQRIK